MLTKATTLGKLPKLGLLPFACALSAMLCATPAQADDPPPEGATGEATGGSNEGTGASGDAPTGSSEASENAPANSTEKSGDAAKDDKSGGDEAAASPGDPREDPLKRYYFLGARFRDIVVPKFMMEIFATGGSTGNIWMIGPEFTTRKGNTEVDIALTYADYGYGPAMFKGKNDTDIAYEVVNSDLKMMYLTFDLLIDIPIDKSGMFSFLIGGGVGVGVVFGDLRHVQAYPKNGTAGDPDDPSTWEKCTSASDGPASPPAPDYCDNGNNYYTVNGQDFSEPSWIDGGSKPVVFPWLSLPQISLRIKPIKQLQIRVDTGFSVSGFFFGLSSGYGF